MIKRVWIQSFRNLKECRLEFDSFRHLYIYGRNNQGKTNFLESLFYIGNGKTPSTSDMDLLVNLNAPVAYLGADLSESEEDHRIYIKLDKINGRHMSINNTEIKTRSALLKHCPMVYLSADINRDYTTTPEARRRRINSVLEQLDPEYKRNVKQLVTILRQKNALLKHEFHQELYDIYNQGICNAAPTIVKKRQWYCNEVTSRLKPLLEQVYKNEFKSIEIRYKSRYLRNNDAIADNLYQCIKDNSFKERQSRNSLYGPQRDDIEIIFNGLDALIFASKGVGRTLSILLTLCDLMLLAEHSGRSLPMFLLDDTLAEIDDEIKQRVISIIQDHAQLIYCTTHKHDRLFFRDVGVFKMESGELINETSS